MVAEAALVAVAVIGTEWLDASVLFVFLKQEGGVMDVGLRDGIAQHGAYQHVVDALPTSFVAVGTFTR